MNNSEIGVIVIGFVALISAALIVLLMITGIRNRTTENVCRSLMSGHSGNAEDSTVSVRKTPLGFRIIVWTIALIVFLQVAAVIWPVVMDPVVYILRYSLDQLLGMELHWLRLGPLMKMVTTIFILMCVVMWLGRPPRKPKDGDGSEEHF